MRQETPIYLRGAVQITGDDLMLFLDVIGSIELGMLRLFCS